MRLYALAAIAVIAACSSSSSGGASDDGGANDGGPTTDAGGGGDDGPTGDAAPGCIADILRQATTAVSTPRTDAPGAVAWQTPENALAADGTTARVELGGADDTENLVVTGYGFSAPPGMHVAGVEVELKRQSPAADVMDGQIFLVLDGKTSPTFHYVANAWPSSIVGTHLYGDVDDMWGMTISNDDVAKTSLGVSLNAKRVAGKAGSPVGLIDSLRMTVIYCPN
jgi:hypothetical protein